MMKTNVKPSSAALDTAKRVVEIREKWHTKNHPFFQEFAKGKLPLRAIGIFMAQHYQFVTLVLPSFGVLYSRAPLDVRKIVVENLAEEEGLAAIEVEGHEPHDHMMDIFAFTRAAGLEDAEVEAMEPTPGWWARTLLYVRTMHEEPVGVALAMQSTQEGQMVALNRDVTLPALEKHYGFKRGAPQIAFFEEHEAADEVHSSKQIELCAKYLDTPELQKRALQVAEQACKLRWASFTDLYRDLVLKEKPILPQGV
jgi:pyrroloquinoline quinone (PQQ) biosynthesis protein C